MSIPFKIYQVNSLVMDFKKFSYEEFFGEWRAEIPDDRLVKLNNIINMERFCRAWAELHEWHRILVQYTFRPECPINLPPPTHSLVQIWIP